MGVGQGEIRWEVVFPRHKDRNKESVVCLLNDVKAACEVNLQLKVELGKKCFEGMVRICRNMSIPSYDERMVGYVLTSLGKVVDEMRVVMGMVDYHGVSCYNSLVETL